MPFFLVLVPFFFFAFFAKANNADTDKLCPRKEVFQQYKQTVEVLNHRDLLAKQILEGSTAQAAQIREIFAHDFDFAKSADYIVQLQKINDQHQGIGEEQSSLYKCLGVLKAAKRQKELASASLELNKKIIEILERNKLSDNTLKNNLELQSNIPALKGDIQKETLANEKIKQNLEVELASSEAKNLTEKDHFKREILAYSNILKKLRIQIINTKIETNTRLTEKLKYLDEYTKKINQIAVSIDGKSRPAVSNRFEEVNAIWLEITKQNFYQILKIELNVDLPKIPPVVSIDADEFSGELVRLKSERQALEQLKADVLNELTEKKKQEVRLLNNLLLQVNRLRSRIYNLLGLSDKLKLLLSVEGLRTFRNEILSTPYGILAFAYHKYFYVSEKIAKRRQGLVELLIDVSHFFLLVVLLGSVQLLIKRLKHWIEHNQNRFLYRFHRLNIFKYVLSFWNRVSENFTPIVWIALILALKTNDAFGDFEIVLDLFLVLLSARVLKSFVLLFLGTVSSVDLRGYSRFKQRAEETADHFVRIYKVYFLLMILVNATVGQVFIYLVVNLLAILVTAWRLISASEKWESEFQQYTEKKFSGVIVESFERFLQYLPRKLHATFLFFGIIFLSTLNSLVRMTENFEVSKKVSAKLFKKQIESIEAEEGASELIPINYKDLFSPRSIDEENIYVTADAKFEEKVLVEIKDFLEGRTDEHSLVLFGDKGIGKTTFVKHITAKLEQESADVKIHYVKMPAKTVSKEAFQEFMQKSILSPLSGEHERSDLLAVDKELDSKVVVVIDEAQNVFLSQTGGFEAYYAMISALNLNTSNVFWLLSLNKYSWLYLDRAFGRNLFFRNVFELKGWSDAKIKELVMKRHVPSGYRLSYDLLINATRSQDEIDRYTSVESKFFKLLWELSHGNPRAALYLWITALSRKNNSVFNVNIPKELDLEGMADLPDEVFFVIAHVLKHENTTERELEDSTNLARGLVRNAIKLGLERKYLFRDERGRLMVDIASQYGLIKYLRIKNFIYGS